MAVHAPIIGAHSSATNFCLTRPLRVRRLLSALSPDEIADAIEVLINVLDARDLDPDAELSGDEEDSDGDELGDQSWAEWHTLRRQQQRASHGLSSYHEDEEDDDPAEEDDHSGDVAHEDELYGYRQTWRMQGPGCPIADPGC